MSVAGASTIGADSKDPRLLPVFIASIFFHGVVFVIFPILTQFLSVKRTFERPMTFQLVSLPQMRSVPQKTAEKFIEKPKEVTKKKKSLPKNPVPATKKSSEAAQKKEDLSELEDLLGSMPQPISNISVGKPFKYPWYLNTLCAKVENNWKPPIKDDKISVVVGFSIYRSGDISAVTLKQSCGNDMLDKLAIRAIKIAAPFPKLPPGEDVLEIDFLLRPTTR